eukprot:sb/3468451/
MLDEETMQGDIQAEYLSILSTEMKITECLVRQILPRELAQQIRDGTPFVNTCQEFSEVTVVFSDMVGFNELCSSLTPMQVETVGDAYLLVGGLPTKDDNHAKYAANIAIEMVQKIQQVKVDFLKSSISVKLGIHTGPVVAGWKVPRFCLSLYLCLSVFGDINTWCDPRQVSMSPMSVCLFVCLSLSLSTPFLQVWWDGRCRGNYITRQRGWHDHKGKGQLPTYWLCGQGDTLLSSYTKEELTEEEAKKQVNDVLEQVGH